MTPKKSLNRMYDILYTVKVFNVFQIHYYYYYHYSLNANLQADILLYELFCLQNSKGTFFWINLLQSCFRLSDSCEVWFVFFGLFSSLCAWQDNSGSVCTTQLYPLELLSNQVIEDNILLERFVPNLVFFTPSSLQILGKTQTGVFPISGVLVNLL